MPATPTPPAIVPKTRVNTIPGIANRRSRLLHASGSRLRMVDAGACHFESMHLLHVFSAMDRRRERNTLLTGGAHNPMLATGFA